MSDIYSVIYSYEKVRSHLESKPEDKEKIKKFIDEIKGDYRVGVLSSMAAFLDKTFAKLYDDLNLEVPEGFDLKETLEKYHVVLVPNHQSHADYIALQYIFFTRFKIPIYIAAGINLNIFPIGGIFKKCGAFFIRRRFDDELYKIAFQGYIYYLLKTDKVVEFFFEGGRTRTGKLLSPRYGLFSMILDAHAKFDSNKKPLMFIPLSVAHEQIPEERAHAKELSGAKKVKEKPTQLLKLYKLFSKKLGTVHVKMGEGLVVDEVVDLKKDTQGLAFKCFRRVGAGMPITPSSLLSLILLDEPSGALTWKQIENRSLEVMRYCQHMKIPMTKSLVERDIIQSLRVAMDMFISNKKVTLVKRVKLNQVFYTLNEESRVHLLYHKNMILHHFFVPAVINATWFNIFNGSIKKPVDLRKFLLKKRKELKYEFYLPTTQNMIDEGKRIIGYSIGRDIQDIEDVLSFSNEELYKVASTVRLFSTALSSIYEGYYIGAISAKFLGDEPFSEDKFLQIAEELFLLEKEHGRVVRYSESYTVPKMKSVINFLVNANVLKSVDENQFQVTDTEELSNLVEKFASDISDQVAINLKFNKDE